MNLSSSLSKGAFTLALVLFGLLNSCSEESDGGVPIQEKEFCDKIHRNDSINLSAELDKLDKYTRDKTGVYILEDGSGSMVARAFLSEYAEKTIDVQYFIFSTDNVGLIACDYLVRAADRGVKVRILVDDIMVDAEVHDILTLSSHENITIKIYNPGVNLGKNLIGKIKGFTDDFRKGNQRMHNKALIVDNQVVITGGRNVADEYFDYDHEYNFRDRDVLLIGKSVKTVSKSFEEFWINSLSVPVEDVVSDPSIEKKDITRFDNLHQYACNPENFWPQVRERIENLPFVFRNIVESGDLVWVDNVVYVSDSPGKNDGKSGFGGSGLSTEALIRLVKDAKVSLDIQTPYLVATSRSQKLFKDAVDKGVKIRILTNSLASTDNLESFSGYQRIREALLKTGVEIYEFKPDAKVRKDIMTGELQDTLDFSPIFGLHAKSMVIDGKITVVGTFNLDPRSANLNTECVTIIPSEKISKGVLKNMETEFLPENSWRTTLKSNPDKFVDYEKQMGVWKRKIIPQGIL